MKQDQEFLQAEGLGQSRISRTLDTDCLPVYDPEGHLDETLLARAGALIRSGALVAFPTETVYGLGANGLDPAAVKQIFAAKGRPGDNPLILHIAAKEQIPPLVDQDLTPYSALMDALWPGPLTLIWKRSARVPDEVTAGGDTVGIRMPSLVSARAFLRACQCPVAAPSANLSGRPSPTNALDVYRDMAGRLPLILDGGDCAIGIESTVVDVTVHPAVILRPGFYTPDHLAPYLPGIRLDPALLDQGQIPKSPGQKYKHYAPAAEMTIFITKSDTMKQVLDRWAADYARAPRPEAVGFLVFDEGKEPLRQLLKEEGFQAPYVISQGSISNLTEMGHSLFTNLRRFDLAGIQKIWAMGVPAEGYGASIMNRMRKAAAGRVIEG